MFEKLKSIVRGWGGTRPEPSDEALELRADRLQEQADKMLRLGRPTDALRCYQGALDIARSLARAHPGDHLHVKAMASILYGMASTLTSLGQPAAAIEALEESEQHYRTVQAAGVRGVEPLIADVQARRGYAQLARGYEASAVLDLDGALRTYRRLLSDRSNDSYALDLARILTMNATVLQQGGDPDLAVASADAAIRIYLSKASTINGTPAAALHATYTCAAATIASEIHAPTAGWIWHPPPTT